MPFRRCTYVAKGEPYGTAMEIKDILPILKNFNAELLIIAFITYIITEIVKKFLPEKYRNLTSIIPFLLSTLIYGAFGYFYKGLTDILLLLTGGIQTGGLATFIYALLKQIFKNKDVKSVIGDILKGILTYGSAKSVAKDIVKNYSEANTLEDNKKLISSTIASSTSISQAECDAITSIIIKAMKNNK